MQKMRQKQQDLEVKQAYEERMKEKAADAAAREKVLQQIAQDKLERKQKQLAMQQVCMFFLWKKYIKLIFFIYSTNIYLSNIATWTTRM